MKKAIAITVLALSALTANHFRDEIVCRAESVHFEVAQECVGMTEGEYTTLKGLIVSEFERDKGDEVYDFDINNRAIILGTLNYELEKAKLSFDDGMTRDQIRTKLINLLKDENS